eukprot:146759-Rhodomonas_salina.3
MTTVDILMQDSEPERASSLSDTCEVTSRTYCDTSVTSHRHTRATFSRTSNVHLNPIIAWDLRRRRGPSCG